MFRLIMLPSIVFIGLSHAVFNSETQLSFSSFETGTEGWYVSSGHDFTVSSSDTASSEGSWSLLVDNRSYNYQGAFFDIDSLVEANTTYIIRGYVKRGGTTDDTFQLNLKVGSDDYRPFGRVLVDDDGWTRFRSFIRLSQADIDAGVSMYLTTSDTENIQSYYLDAVEIAKTAYAPPAESVGGILTVSGEQLVTPDAKSVYLRGINMIAYSDEDASTGDNSATEFMNYSYYNYDREDFHTIAALGFNSIRLSLWYRYFEDETNPYVLKDSGFEWLDTIIGWAKEAGLYVMLDMHAPQGGGFQGPSNVTDFWSVTDYRDRFNALWLALAQRYRYEPTVAAYDLLNEPCPPQQSDYLNLLNTLITDIRAVDPDHIINVENSFADDTSLFILEQENILYDFHFYDPWDTYTASDTAVYGSDVTSAEVLGYLDEFLDFYDGKAVHVGEFGQRFDPFEAKNAAGWVDDVMARLIERKAHFHYFSFKGNVFGLYSSKNAFASDSVRNDTLAELIENHLKRPSGMPGIYYLLLN